MSAADASIPADLLNDYASDVEREVKRIEDGVLSLHALVESMRREADRAKQHRAP